MSAGRKRKFVGFLPDGEAIPLGDAVATDEQVKDLLGIFEAVYNDEDNHGSFRIGSSMFCVRAFIGIKVS